MLKFEDISNKLSTENLHLSSKLFIIIKQNNTVLLIDNGGLETHAVGTLIL